MAVARQTDDYEVRYMDTRSCYDAWSEVYDTDGNFLQALDTMEMKSLLPRMLSLIQAEKPWRIVDLGCGTGRNTMALLSVPDIEVTALDLSEKMLEVAKKRLSDESKRLARSSEVNFDVFDMLTATDLPLSARNSDAVVSTLVIEHVPMDVFFATVAKILKTGGLLLLTNMHSEMGGISQAGFIDPGSGIKLRPESYAHTVADIVSVAGQFGMEVVGRIDERSVDADLAPKLGDRATKWVGITVWLGGIFRKVS